MTQPALTPPATRRSQQKAETRALILEAAKELFEERGFEKTTIRAVAARAGVGLGTVMSHFPNKGRLVTAAFMGDMLTVLARVEADLAPETGFREQMLHLASRFYAYYAARPALSRVLLREHFFVYGEANEEFRAWELGFLDQVAQRLAQAQARGEVRADLDCALATEALFSNHLYVLYAGLSQAEVKAEEMLDRLARMADLILAGPKAD